MKKHFSIIMCLLFILSLIATNSQILATKRVLASDNYWSPLSNWFNYTGPMDAMPLECLALSPNAPVTGALSSAQIQQAYNLSSSGGQGTIAIVDPYDDPTIMNDANVFCSQYNLPNLTSSNFNVVKQTGGITTDANWTLETSLDVEWAHAMAPNAKILLVEALNESEVLYAVDYARDQPDVIAVSMSWGFLEADWAPSVDFVFQPGPFGNPSCCFFAAAGDERENVSYPASSPSVVGVGGTTLTFENGQFSSETVWNTTTIYGTGGGISKFFNEPSFQSSYGVPNANGKRCVPDVSFDAGSSVSVYDSSYSEDNNWQSVIGTSLGTACWAAIYSRSLTASNGRLYQNAEILSIYQTKFRDITSGGNGLYNATTAYDKVTGLGSPLTTTYNVPIFAMKTLTDGKFYNPNQTVPYFKVEEWFTDNSSAGDQGGNTTSGYPFGFPDGKVGLTDLTMLAKAYGFSEGGYKDPTHHWNYQIDINNDGKVSLSDLSILAKDYTSSSKYNWYTMDPKHISINFTITGNSQPVTGTLDSNGFAAIPANCTGWLVFKNDTNTAVGAFLTFWG